MHDKLFTKVNNIDTSGFVLKTKYTADISELEKKISDTSGLVNKLKSNAKITEIECKIRSISALATTSTLTAVENKIPSISTLFKKKNYNSKISKIEKRITDHNRDKYITSPEFNNLVAKIFTAKLAHENLVKKTELDTKMRSLNQKISSNKT